MFGCHTVLSWDVTEQNTATRQTYGSERELKTDASAMYSKELRPHLSFFLRAVQSRRSRESTSIRCRTDCPCEKWIAAVVCVHPGRGRNGYPPSDKLPSTKSPLCSHRHSSTYDARNSVLPPRDTPKSQMKLSELEYICKCVVSSHPDW